MLQACTSRVNGHSAYSGQALIAWIWKIRRASVTVCVSGWKVIRWRNHGADAGAVFERRAERLDRERLEHAEADRDREQRVGGEVEPGGGHRDPAHGGAAVDEDRRARRASRRRRCRRRSRRSGGRRARRCRSLWWRSAGQGCRARGRRSPPARRSGTAGCPRPSSRCSSSCDERLVQPNWSWR